MPELSVVIPAYRERDNLPPLLDALERALQGIDWEAVIVIDDSLDGSEDYVRQRAQRDRRIRCLQRIGRRGLASACIEGMLATSSPYVAVMDADRQHDEALLPQMLAAARADDTDIVVGSRYVAGGTTGELPRARVRISRFATLLSGGLGAGLSDPMSGFFLLKREYLERVVRRLYGRGFKILLDLIAAAEGAVQVHELPYRMRGRTHGESKLGVRVITEYLMLLAYHLAGRLLPARFFLFAAVGLSGVGVHLAALWALFQVRGGGFLASQAVATGVAMTSNFFLNNAITYGDVRLRGAALWRGLLSFYVACGFGVLINLAVADWLYLQLTPYWLAGLAGAVTAAVWNFMTTASVTWGPQPKERARP